MKTKNEGTNVRFSDWWFTRFHSIFIFFWVDTRLKNVPASSIDFGTGKMWWLSSLDLQLENGKMKAGKSVNHRSLRNGHLTISVIPIFVYLTKKRTFFFCFFSFFSVFFYKKKATARSQNWAKKKSELSSDLLLLGVRLIALVPLEMGGKWGPMGGCIRNLNFELCWTSHQLNADRIGGRFLWICSWKWAFIIQLNQSVYWLIRSSGRHQFRNDVFLFLLFLLLRFQSIYLISLKN